MSDEKYERYWVLDAEDPVNKLAEVRRAAELPMVGIVDERFGGVIGYVVEQEANTIVDVLNAAAVKRRLEELRGELRAESISWGELQELQGLAGYIEPGDVELLEAAGVPEFPEEGGHHE